MDAYRLVGKIGEGAFGEVFKATHMETGRVVALKKIRIRGLDQGIPKNLLREMQALEKLQHPNVLELYDTFPHGSAIVLACEFMLSDLHQVLRALATKGQSLPESVLKSLLLMLLKGVAAVHDANLVHRDLKPANLLFAPSGALKLGDFGRWYRAPELLYGSRGYDSAVDLWAVGCIFAELINRSPLFPGENDIDQLYRVHRALGTPDEKNWPGCTELPDFNKITFPPIEPVPMEKLVPEASPAAISLLRRLLVYSPERRITAKEALTHDYFFTFPPPLHYSQLLPLARLPLRKQPSSSSSSSSTTSGAASLSIAALGASVPGHEPLSLQLPASATEAEGKDGKLQGSTTVPGMAAEAAAATAANGSVPPAPPASSISISTSSSSSLVFPFRRHTGRIRLRKTSQRQRRSEKEGGGGGDDEGEREREGRTFDVAGPFRLEEALPW